MLSTPAIDKGLALLRHRLERERKGEGQGVGRSPWRSRLQAGRHSPLPPSPPPPYPENSKVDNSDQAPRYFVGLAAMAKRQVQDDAAGTPPRGLPVPFVRRIPCGEQVPPAQSKVMPSSPRAPRTFSRSIVPIKKYRGQCLRRLGREVLAVLVANRRSKARVMRYLHSLILNKSK